MAKKGKGFWLVTSKTGDVYRGPDRAKARAAAAKELSAGLAVEVFRVSRSVTLTADALKASLPKDSF